MDTPITREALERSQGDCYKTNIKPIMNEIKELKADIKDLGKDFGDFKIELKEIVARMPYQIHEHVMIEADKKYATKLTQKIVFGIVGIILSAVFGGIVALVVI